MDRSQINPFLLTERERERESARPIDRNATRITPRDETALSRGNKAKFDDLDDILSSCSPTIVIKRTGTSSMCFSGVTSAPKGTTHFLRRLAIVRPRVQGESNAVFVFRSDQLKVVVIICVSLLLLLLLLWCVFIRATINKLFEEFSPEETHTRALCL